MLSKRSFGRLGHTSRFKLPAPPTANFHQTRTFTYFLQIYDDVVSVLIPQVYLQLADQPTPQSHRHAHLKKTKIIIPHKMSTMHSGMIKTHQHLIRAI